MKVLTNLWEDVDAVTGAFKSAAGIPQTITYSTTPTHAFTSGNNAVLVLTGNVTTYTMTGVPDGKGGTIEIRQNEVGGFGIAAIAHSGLTVEMIGGKNPTAVNINTGAGESTILSYWRSGSKLFFAFPIKDLTAQTLTYASTVTHDTNNGKDAFLLLTGVVTTYTLTNVTDGQKGTILLKQNAVGGHGILEITHSGLTVLYKDGNKPVTTYINIIPQKHTILEYYRQGSILFIEIKKMHVLSPLLANILSGWEMDNSGAQVDDSFGTNHGTATGTTVVAGLMGSCRQFNGTSDKVNFAVPAEINAGMTNDFSISFWAKRTASLSNNIVFALSVNSTNFIVLGYINGAIQCCFSTTGLTAWLASPVTSINIWYHVVLTFNATTRTFKYYTDKVQRTSAVSQNFAAGANGTFSIGANAAGTSWFTGQYDQQVYFNKELTQAEIDKINNEGYGLKLTDY